MAYKFSKRSLLNLGTCHPDLQAIFVEAIEHMDFTVICGHRGEQEQNAAFELGNSKLKYPESKHNFLPSKAVDAAPHPIDWEDIERFAELANVVKEIAKAKGIKIVWGGDWKMKDYPHFELA